MMVSELILRRHERRLNGRFTVHTVRGSSLCLPSYIISIIVNWVAFRSFGGFNDYYYYKEAPSRKKVIMIE